jgi:hypothetical protein
MSVFSGKCDFYDIFVNDLDDNKIEEKLKNTSLLVMGKDGRGHTIKADTIKDIAAYYPYTEIFGVHSNNNYDITLSSDSFIDKEEAERIQWRVDSVLKYWRKCKRKKIKFDEKKCLDEISWDDDAVKEIIHRIAENGDKAEFKDIHLPMHEYYRKLWYEEMVKVGYTEFQAFCWVYKEILPTAEDMEKRLNTEW